MQSKQAQKHHWIGLIVILITAFLSNPVVTAADGKGTATALFDWSMPSRTPDSNSDGLIDYYRWELHQIAAPESGWHVLFDACDSSSTSGLGLLNFAWYINGVFTSETHICDGFSYDFPAEGSYEVKLVVSDPSGASDDQTHLVPVQDWLVVAIGDSYGSGEGNPDFPIAEDPFGNAQDALVILGDQINALKTAGDDLDTRMGTLETKIADLAQAEIDLDAVIAELKPAEDAFALWKEVCIENWDETACGFAFWDLVVALGAAGIGAAEDLVTQGVDAVRDRLDQLSAVAEAAVETAQSAVDLASTNVTTAETAFTTARTVAEDAVAYWNFVHPDDPVMHDVIYPVDVADMGGLAWPAALWMDGRCHRSPYSGQAKAALEIEKADPRTSVTFLQLSCSGATVADGLVGPYNGPGFDPEVGDSSVDGPEDCDDETEIYVQYDNDRKYCMLIPQVQRIPDLVDGREIDALLVSVGGNDVYFAPIVTACMFQEPCFADDFSSTDGGQWFQNNIGGVVTQICDPLYPLQFFWEPDGGAATFQACNSFFDDLSTLAGAEELVSYFYNPNLSGQIVALSEKVCPVLGTLSELSAECTDYFHGIQDGLSAEKTAKQMATEGFAKLQDEYESLAFDLEQYLPDFAQNRLFITEYPNATRDENGEYCNFDLTYPLVAFPGGTAAEQQWLENNMITVLDEHIAALGVPGDDRYMGWNPVVGIFEAGLTHGYCSEQNWLHRLQDSLLSQMEVLGAVHPTPEGHDSYRDRIFTEVMGKLYQGGDLSLPRRPQQPPVADAGGPYILAEGQSAQIDHNTFDYNNDELNYSWGLVPPQHNNLTFNNSKLEFPTLIAKDDYDGTLQVKVWDNYGSSFASAPILVKNRPPVISDISGDTTFEGEPSALSILFDDPGVLDTHDAAIDWGDGTHDSFTGISNPFSDSHVYLDEGEGKFTVAARLTDDDGGFIDGDITMFVENAPPVVYAGADRTLAEGSPVPGHATYTDPGILDTHAALVSWDDGSPDGPETTVSGGTVPLQYVYADNGSYAVSVCVKDNDGASACDDFIATVTNLPPLVNGGSDLSALEGNFVTVDQATFNDPGTLDTHTASISWGDSTTVAGTVSESPFGPPGSTNGANGQLAFTPYVYADNGTYTVETCVVDDDGESGCGTASVIVGNVEPFINNINFGAGQTFFLSLVEERLQVNFHDQGTLDTHSATIDWGDGTTDNAAIDENPTFPGSSTGLDGVARGSHTYSEAGSYRLAFMVEDDDGGSAADETTIEVIDPTEAIERLIEDITSLASDPTIDSDAAYALAEVLKDLQGPKAGSSKAGALDKLAGKDFSAAVLKITAALEDLEQARSVDSGLDLMFTELILAKIAESIGADLLAQAEAAIDWNSKGAVKQIEKLRTYFLEAQVDLDAAHYIEATLGFHEVVRRAEQLI